MQIKDLPMLSQMVGENITGRPGGAVSLAVGMAHVFSSLPGMKGLMSYWYQYVIMFEALFILTTIDAGTRVARYIAQDFLGLIYKPFKNSKSIILSIVLSAIVSFAWGYLLYGGDITTIWPIFGVSNQLLATLALAIGSNMILRRTKKLSYTMTTFLPMLFMGVTSTAAGFLTIVNNYIPKHQTLPAVLAGLMIILATIIVADSIRKLLETYSSISSDHDQVGKFAAK